MRCRSSIAIARPRGSVPWCSMTSRASPRRVADMIAHGFTAHWGSDGSVPELRYGEAGGMDLVVENVACFGDGKPRKNILLPLHDRAGIAFGFGSASKLLCVAQELVHHKGTFGALPARARPGDVVHVEGDLDAPFEFGAVGIAWLDLPRPMSSAALHATGSYALTMNAKTSGLYEVIVHARAPNAGARIDPVSARVVRIDP